MYNICDARHCGMDMYCRSYWAHRRGDAAVGAASKVSETLRDEFYGTGMSPIKDLLHPRMGGNKEHLGLHRMNWV